METIPVDIKAVTVTDIQFCATGLLIHQHNSSQFVNISTCTSQEVLCNAVVSSNLAFEWWRRPLFSSWVKKWPMKSQSLGRMTRRFMVLRDQELLYYDREIMDIMDYDQAPIKVVTLTEICTARRGSHFRVPCITIDLPDGDRMWFTLDDSNADDEDIWISEINRSISRLRELSGHNDCKSPFAGLVTTESTWISNNIKDLCIATDIQDTVTQGYNKVALFGCQRNYFVTYKKFDGMHYDHKVQCRDDVALLHIKLIGNFMILAGTRGWVGVMSCEEGSALNLGRASHYVESCITAISVYQDKATGQAAFVTGDRLGGVGLWTLDQYTATVNLEFFGDIEMPISHLRLLGYSGRLLVGTTENLMLFDINPVVSDDRVGGGSASGGSPRVSQHLHSAPPASTPPLPLPLPPPPLSPILCGLPSIDHSRMHANSSDRINSRGSGPPGLGNSFTDRSSGGTAGVLEQHSSGGGSLSVVPGNMLGLESLMSRVSLNSLTGGTKRAMLSPCMLVLDSRAKIGEISYYATFLSCAVNKISLFKDFPASLPSNLSISSMGSGFGGHSPSHVRASQTVLDEDSLPTVGPPSFSEEERDNCGNKDEDFITVWKLLTVDQSTNILTKLEIQLPPRQTLFTN